MGSFPESFFVGTFFAGEGDLHNNQCALDITRGGGKKRGENKRTVIRV